MTKNPPFENEANLQAEMYCELKALGLDPVLEYWTPYGRVDIAILGIYRTTLRGIVEVKAKRRDLRKAEFDQIARYRKNGVKVWGVANGDNPKEACAKIAKELEGVDGKPLYRVKESRTERINSEQRSDSVYNWRQAQARIEHYRKTGIKSNRLFTDAELDAYVPMPAKNAAEEVGLNVKEGV